MTTIGRQRRDRQWIAAILSSFLVVLALTFGLWARWPWLRDYLAISVLDTVGVALGGTLDVHSPIGAGTRLRVELPSCGELIPPWGRAGRARPGLHLEPTPHANRRVLAVLAWMRATRA